MIYAGLMLGAVLVAFFAVHAKRLLASAIWLALLSALSAVLFYSLGAFHLAVIELSVGAGLVTVLFVFAIAVSGGEKADGKPAIPTGVAALFGLVMMALLAWLVLPIEAQVTDSGQVSFIEMLWEGRALDVMVQLAIIFSGVVAVLGLLGEKEDSLPFMHQKEKGA